MDNQVICFEDQYVISDEKLGEGGFGAVYKGIDVKNSRFIACKVMSLEAISKVQKLQELLVQEITLQLSLKSNFTVQLHKVYKTEKSIFLILEYCDGGDLMKLVMDKGPIPEQTAIGYLLQILAGFRELHSKSIIHRDLKPANILLSGKTLKIADFGAARTIENDNLGNTKIGTLLFLAPEIQEGKEYGFEVDIFSLGVLLYFMLFKDFPFIGTTNIQIYNAMKSESIDFKKNGVTISPQLIDFLKRLLKYDRDQRITWAQIYQHPIIAKNLKNDNISAEIIIAPSAADIKMYQDPKFLNKKAPQQKLATSLSDINASSAAPNKVSQAAQEQKKKEAELTQKIAIEMYEGIRKYVHKRNVYGVLLALAHSFKQLKDLKINYQISAYLIQKKMKALNWEMVKPIRENKNIFQMQYFDIFRDSEYYTKIKAMYEEDYTNIQKFMQPLQNEALESMQKLSINNNRLKAELSSTEVSAEFDQSLIGSMMSYGDGLQKYMKQTNDEKLKLLLFFQTVLVYEICCIDKIFTNKQDFDFEKHKLEILQTPPEKYQQVIEQSLNRIFS